MRFKEKRSPLLSVFEKVAPDHNKRTDDIPFLKGFHKSTPGLLALEKPRHHIVGLELML